MNKYDGYPLTNKMCSYGISFAETSTSLVNFAADSQVIDTAFSQIVPLYVDISTCTHKNQNSYC